MQIVARLGRAAPFLLVAVICLYLFNVANQFDFVVRAGRPGPDIWPMIVLILILFASAWGAVEALLVPNDADGMSVMVRAAVRAIGREGEAERELEAEAGGDGERRPLRALAAILMLVAFVGSIAFVGFTVATFVLMFAIMLLAGYKRPLIAAVIALLGTLAFFFVFQRVAYVSLPLGVGPFKELSTTLMAIFGVR
jgi:putative tricarboxylic transport membrane protein